MYYPHINISIHQIIDSKKEFNTQNTGVIHKLHTTVDNFSKNNELYTII